MWFVLLLLSADPSLPKMAEFTKSIEFGRKQRMAQLDEWYRHGIQTRKKNIDRSQLKYVNEKLKDLKEEFDALDKGPVSGYPLPDLQQKRFSKGQIGRLPGTYEVLQVLDGKSASVRPVGGDDRFHVEGPDIKDKFADGDKTTIGGNFEVIGTTSYTTVLGAKATVFVLRSFDAAPYYAELKKREAAKQKPKAKPTTRSTAASQLRLAKKLLDKKPDVGRKRLQAIIDKYPDSNAAKEAAELLK